MLADSARPLNSRGRRDAPLMARRLAAELKPPFRLVSSPALRAITTAQIFADALAIRHADIRIEPRIYEATPGTLLHLINSVDDDDPQLLMFGHNPGFTELAKLLAEVPFADLPTCAAATFSFKAKRWRDITPGSGSLLSYRFPKGAEN